MEDINESEFALIAAQFIDEEEKENINDDKDTKKEKKSSKKEKKSANKKVKKDKKRKTVEPKEPPIEHQSTEEVSNEDNNAKKPKKKKKGKEPKEVHEDKDKGRASIKEEPKERISRTKSENSETKVKTSKGKKKKKTEEDIKEKVSRSKGGDKGQSNKDEKQTVFEYMKQQNRPYSLINVFDNLHSSIKKPQLQKILDALVDEKLLIMKEYNTKIYLANQNLFETVTEERMKELEKEENDTKEIIAELKDELQSKQNELKTIMTTFTDEELNSRIIQKEKGIKETTIMAEQIKSNAIEPIPTEKMNEAEKKYEANKIKYKKIKAICLDILDQLGEGLEMNREKLMEEIGIENDDELIKTYKLQIK